MKYLVYTLLVLACVGSLVRAENINWNSTDWDTRIANEQQQQIMRRQMENIADEASNRAVIQGLLLQGYTPAQPEPIQNNAPAVYDELDYKSIDDLSERELELCSDNIHMCPNVSKEIQQKATDKIVDKHIQNLVNGMKDIK